MKIFTMEKREKCAFFCENVLLFISGNRSLFSLDVQCTIIQIDVNKSFSYWAFDGN